MNITGRFFVGNVSGWPTFFFFLIFWMRCCDCTIMVSDICAAYIMRSCGSMKRRKKETAKWCIFVDVVNNNQMEILI